MGERARIALIGIFCLILALPFVASCSVRTPEIHGVVLDEKTKEPVKDAWINCSLYLVLGTLGGEVHNSYVVSPPHLRTDDRGHFIIPSKTVGPTITLGTTIRGFGVNAETMDDRDGYNDLLKDRRRRKVDVTIHVQPNKDAELDRFTHLQGLSKYCETGRFGIEVPQQGLKCDDWELDFAIALHERFLERFSDPKTGDERGHFSLVMRQLGYLYQQKGTYSKSLSTFSAVRKYDEGRNVTLWLREYDARIEELREKIAQQKKK
jgi:hypothetical protein